MWRRAAVILTFAAACWMLTAGTGMAASAASPAGHWGNAQKLAGLGKLNAHDAQVTAVSCATPGDCAAGGNYEDAATRLHAFVADAKTGRWGKAIPVAMPGSAVTSQVDSVSCGSPANCEAAGSFTDSGSHWHVFVVAEVNGAWARRARCPAWPRLPAPRCSPTSAWCHVLQRVTAPLAEGGAKICAIKLAKGRGSCTLSARQLKPGRYQLSGVYGGDRTYDGSAYPDATLTVTK